jgi:HPt (histidine-containing phosphotransfer) domain-containing protein
VGPDPARELKRLRDEYAGELPALLDGLQADLAAGALAAAHRKAHTLCGTSGLYEMDEVSAEARALERLLRAAPPAPEAVAAALARLREAAGRLLP